MVRKRREFWCPLNRVLGIFGLHYFPLDKDIGMIVAKWSSKRWTGRSVPRPSESVRGPFIGTTECLLSSKHHVRRKQSGPTTNESSWSVINHWIASGTLHGFPLSVVENAQTLQPCLASATNNVHSMCQCVAKWSSSRQTVTSPSESIRGPFIGTTEFTMHVVSVQQNTSRSVKQSGLATQSASLDSIRDHSLVVLHQRCTSLVDYRA